MNKSIKDLASWLKDEVEFLKENPNYVGGWNQLGNGLAVVVLWEEGYGKEKRDDVIQNEDDLDYALCAGIRIYNPSDTPDGWNTLWDKDGNVLLDTFSISPDEDFNALAKDLLKQYDGVKDANYGKDGHMLSNDLEESRKICEDDGSNYDGIISKHFIETYRIPASKQLIQIVQNIIAKVDRKYYDYDDIKNAIDYCLRANHDKWEVAEYYCSNPIHFNWDDVMFGFFHDVQSIIEEIDKLDANE